MLLGWPPDYFVEEDFTVVKFKCLEEVVAGAAVTLQPYLLEAKSLQLHHSIFPPQRSPKVMH